MNDQPEALRLADELSRAWQPTAQQAAAELRRLHQILHDIYEVWAGSEGLPEGYMRTIIEQMRDLAKEGLK